MKTYVFLRGTPTYVDRATLRSLFGQRIIQQDTIFPNQKRNTTTEPNNGE